MHKCLLLVGFLASAFALPATAADFYVSPAGADTNPGTQTQPFATLSRARDALRASGKLGRQPLTVHLLPGIYYLPEALTFTPADSGTATAPVVYQGDPGGEVVVSGGLKLNLSWQPYQNGILQAKVPAGLAIDQLFLNGQRQHMARYPNYEPDQRIMHGYAADAFSPQRVARWSDPAGGFIHAMHPAEWGDVHFLITGKKPDGSLSYEGGWQNNRGGAMHKAQRFVENIFEELDAPGEWFYNPKTSTLFCLPPAGVDLSQAVVEVVRLRHLVELQGQPAKPVRFLTLRGLTFRHAARTFMQNREPLNRSDWTTYRGGAVFANGTEDCQLADCSFDQLGGNSIFVNAYNRRFAVRGCLIQAGGANGIAFVGDTNAVRSLLLNYNQPFDYVRLDRTPGPQSDNYPADCLVEDCLITRTGQFERQTAGVQISMSTGITVRHCSIYDVPRAGINISEGCWGGHLVEFCDVFDTVKETGDHGSFNSWGRDRYWHPNSGTINREVAADPALPRLDILKPNVLRNSRWRCDHGWDIDLDDGSSYYEIYNNLCLNGGIKNREGYHRLVTNNIIVNNSFHPHVWLANSGDVFKHNIVMGSYRPAVMPPGKWGQEVDYNFFTTSESDRTRFAPNDCDAHSLVGDPLFVDPAAGNYQLREGSPALKLGFQNFSMDQYGVRKPALRAIAKTPKLPQLKPVASAAPAPERLDFFCQARVRDISGLGDRSAYGLPDESGVLLLDVPPASPLGRAGFLKDDVILQCNAQPVRNLAGLLQLQKLASGAPLKLSALRKQQPVAAQVRDYAPGQQSQPFPAFTNPAPATLRVKADAPTYLYGAGASVREGDIRKQAGDYFYCKGRGLLTWTVQVDRPGDYQVSLCHATEPRAPGYQLQLACGNSQLSYTLVPTKGAFSSYKAFEMLPFPGALHLQAGTQTITLSIPTAPEAVPVLAFRSLELIPVAAKPAIEADRQAARRARASTDWLAKAGYGLMFHWTSQSIGKDGSHKPYAQAVDDFDLPRFVDMVQETGAGYVLFTIGHAQPFCPAPLKSWEKYHPGKTTRRDLVAEMADALNAKGIKLMCYFPTHVIGKYPQASGPEFSQMVNEVIREFGQRYQQKVAGYWFDGCYQCYEKYPAFSFRDFFQSCKAGNPNRIIALNSWIYPNVSEWQDYWAGEAFNLIGLPVNGTNERGPGQGLRYQALVVMEPYWVQEKAAMTPPRFSAQTLGNFVTGCIHNGGAVTINLGIYQDGSVDPAAVNVLKDVRKLVRQSPQ